MLGELPSDFLRVTPISAEQQLALDEQAAIALQQQLTGNPFASPVAGRLTISVIEVSNYAKVYQHMHSELFLVCIMMLIGANIS